MTDLEDPLQEYKGLSLFPRTLASLPNPPHPHDSDDPHFIHNFLKSLPVKNPEKLMEQAKNILDDAIEVPNVKMTDDAASKENNEAVTDMAVKYPRGQRPGLQLQRKRPRFSLIPNISQPTVNPEPTFDFDKYKDPEEFFMACERLENARKEIAKQTGRAFTDSDQYNVFMVPQSQRPGIPGRSKMAKYKHLYSAMPSQNTCEEDILSNSGSQGETTQPDVASQRSEPANVESQSLESTNDASQQTELENVALEEMELNGSISNAENRVSQLLDDLLSHNSGELEGERGVNLLQECLHIKPIHIEKLNLPEMQDIQRIDFKVSEINLPKSRNILSDINNLLSGSRNTTTMELKNVGSSLSGFGSRTPPKSPLASFSLMKKHIFQSNNPSNPFSFTGIDQLPARNASPVKSINEHSDPVDLEETFCTSHKLKSPTSEKDDVPAGRWSSNEVAIEGPISCLEKHVNENLTSFHSESEISPRESESQLKNNKIDMGNEFINENSRGVDVDVDLHRSGLDDMDNMDPEVSARASQNTDDFPVETSNSIHNRLDQSNPSPADGHASNECPGIQDGSPKQIKETAPEQNIKKVQEPSMVSTKKQCKRKLQSRKSQHKLRSYRGQGNKDLSARQGLADPEIVKVHPADRFAECMNSASVQSQDTALEQTQKIQESSAVSMNEQAKGKSHPGKDRKSKNLSSRQSLAGCGLSWKAGVRRSTRIRSRPLEYWRGERFLYGRIHQSLATIIGIKYESPNGGPTMKVKSFVSDEYKDLVEQAALY